MLPSVHSLGLACLPGLAFPISVSASPCLCLQVSMSSSSSFHVYISPCFHVSMILQKVNGTNSKRQLWYIFWKWNTGATYFCLFAPNENVKRKFVFLGRQTINSDWRLLFQQTCPSMSMALNSSVCSLKKTLFSEQFRFYTKYITRSYKQNAVLTEWWKGQGSPLFL